MHATSLANVFHIRPGLADEAYKIVRHCATLSQDRIAVFSEDDALGRAGQAAVAALLKTQPQAIIQVSLFNSSGAFIRRAGCSR